MAGESVKLVIPPECRDYKIYRLWYYSTVTSSEFLQQLRIDIESSPTIPEEYRPHSHSPPVQLKSVLLAHLDLVIQVANADSEKRRFGIESAKASWRQVLDVISKYGPLDKYRDYVELGSGLQRFFKN